MCERHFTVVVPRTGQLCRVFLFRPPNPQRSVTLDPKSKQALAETSACQRLLETVGLAAATQQEGQAT